MLHQFKSFDANRMQLDELVSLEAFGHDLREAFERLGIEEPAYLDTQLKQLRREVRTRNADRLEGRRKEIQIRLDSLKTPTEKKAELLKEKAVLDKELAKIG
jgi:hypothetical protein